MGEIYGQITVLRQLYFHRSSYKITYKILQDTVTTGKLPLSEAQNLSLFFWTDMEVALPGVVESELNLSKNYIFFVT